MPLMPSKRAYSAEELLALRRSASEEKAAVMQQKVDESVIRDHVVRTTQSRPATRSASSNMPSASSREQQDSRLSFTGPMLNEIDTNNQRLRAPMLLRGSPTPSLKKKKAEQILQQHGSPPGVRVTAGGRIVPSEHSPLCSPRYGYSAIQRNGGLIKFAPGYPPPPKTFPNFAKSLPNGFVAQDPSGRLCQMVDGRFLQIPEVNGIPQLYITAPNVTNLSWSRFNAGDSTQSSADTKRDPRSGSDNTAAPGPEVASQIASLEKDYDQLEVERRGLDKAEVLKRTELSGKSYAQLVQKRRELVNRQDEIRRSIKSLQDGRSSGTESSAGRPSTRSSPNEVQYPQYLMPGQFPQIAQWGEEVAVAHQPPQFMSPHMNPHVNTHTNPQMNTHTPLEQMHFPGHMVYPGGYPLFMHGGPNQMQQAAKSQPAAVFHQGLPPLRTGVAHAGQVPRPLPLNTEQVVTPGLPSSKSVLNPMSPAYEPTGNRLPSPQRKTPTEPASMAKARAIRQASERSVVPKSSDSSFATADFFPNNPREHSLNPDQYPVSGNLARSETLPVPRSTQQPELQRSTSQPEMERHNVNWNPTIPDQAFQSVAPIVQSPIDSSMYDVDAQTRLSSPPQTPRLGADEEFNRGYRAGLRIEPIGNNLGQAFIAGYCKALLESASEAGGAAKKGEPAQPEKPVVRLPSASSNLKQEQAPLAEKPAERPTLPQSGLDAIKKAITAPNNEIALLSPDPEGLSVDSIAERSLGSWAKRKVEENSDENLRIQPSVQTQAGATQFQLGHPINANGSRLEKDPNVVTEKAISSIEYAQRAFSSQSNPAKSSIGYASRMHPGLRVLSTPGMDWKSSSSMAHVAGMASGYFAQFDGTASKSMASLAGVNPGTDARPSRFEEAAIPGSSPPSVSPDKESRSSSPKKPISPAKAKFAAIAGKAGIKVRTDRPGSKETNELDLSPQERRRWRDVWKKRNVAPAE